MEARTELRGSRMSKGLVVVIAVCVTLGLGVTAGIVAKNVNGTTATQTHVVKIQSAPAESTYPMQRSGLQMGDRSGAPAAGTLAPALLDRNAERAAKPTAVPNPRNVKGLREI
jgi:hypothetical protein